jgi:amino-acid N-acetyltransferase
MHVAPAPASDFDALQQLLSSADLPTEDLTPTDLEHFFVARDETKIVGAVGAEVFDDVALLRSLVVAPSYRNTGLGAHLTETVEAYAHHQGIDTLYLLTTTAAEFFEQQGYHRIERDQLPRPIQTTDEATQLCPSSATCMQKRLAPHSERAP